MNVRSKQVILHQATSGVYWLFSGVKNLPRNTVGCRAFESPDLLAFRILGFQPLKLFYYQDGASVPQITQH